MGYKIHNWTKEEIKTLKKHYPSKTNNTDLMKLLPGRTFYAIKTMAKKYKLKRGKYHPSLEENIPRKWAIEEVKLLNDYYGSVEDKELLKMLPGRSMISLKHMAKKLDLKKPYTYVPGTPWTAREDEFLIENFSKLPNVELLKFLSDRTLVAVKARAQKLGLKRDKNTWAPAGPYRPWKEEEIAIVKNNWNKMSVEDLAKLIGYATGNGILKQAKKMKLEPYDKQKFEDKKPRIRHYYY